MSIDSFVRPDRMDLFNVHQRLMTERELRDSVAALMRGIRADSITSYVEQQMSLLTGGELTNG